MKYKTRTTHLLIALVGAIVALAAATPTAISAIPNADGLGEGTHAPDAPETPDELRDLAGMLNTKTTPRLVDGVGDSCQGGTGCGACSASVNCGESQAASCTCAPTGDTCGWGPWEKPIYACNCECVAQPDPPPSGICVDTPVGTVCIDEPPYLE